MFTLVDAKIDLICNWIKDYFVENGPDCKAIIGISGGKDSTVCAALLCRALGPERVVGVLMPQDVQNDIDDAREVCAYLGIASIEVDIGPACSALYRAIDEGWDFDHQCKNIPGISTNTPARMRMATLYAIATLVHGRVCNTCNRSEDYIGYSTKFGDAAGDFSILSNYTVAEVLEIGESLNLPAHLVGKVPQDGMCGKTDEENLGFTYEVLDAFLMENTYPTYEVYKNIQQRHERNLHKLKSMPVCPHF